MQVRIARLPWYAAALAAIVAAAVSGCASSSSTGSSSTGASGSATTAAPVTALDAVKLAASTSSHANTFTGTMNMAITAKPGAPSSAELAGTSMTMTMAEQLRPSLLLSADITSLTSAGQSIPGGLSEVITPSTAYLKAPFLTQAADLTKPWLSVPLSSAGQASGVNLSQLMNEATTNSPLSETQMFAAATSVHKVGTGTIDGVPVTEYTGTVPMSAAMAKDSSVLSTQLKQQISSLGFTTETFTVWIDGQHLTRKAHIVAVGTSVTETVNLTITSINQPVHITPPPASETESMAGLG